MENMEDFSTPAQSEYKYLLYGLRSEVKFLIKQYNRMETKFEKDFIKKMQRLKMYHMFGNSDEPIMISMKQKNYLLALYQKYKYDKPNPASIQTKRSA